MRALDYLFFHCYNWATYAKMHDKSGFACDRIIILLLEFVLSLFIVSLYIMPRKCALLLVIFLLIGFVLLSWELYYHYEDEALVKDILKRYKKSSIIKSILIYFLYFFLVLLPALVAVLINNFF